MFEHTSRYYKIKEAVYTAPDGRRIIYKCRRFLPRGETLSLSGEVTVLDDDRPDLVTFRSVGAPELFWRICDANDAMNPFDLTDTPGRKLAVPGPQNSQT